MNDDRFDNRPYYNDDTFGIQSTAGAVPIINKKGEVSMKKVKVQRYISGKIPDYAREENDSSDESSGEDDFTVQQHRPASPTEINNLSASAPSYSENVQDECNSNLSDPRLRRLQAAKSGVSSNSDYSNDNERLGRRRIYQAEVLSDDTSEENRKSSEPSFPAEDKVTLNAEISSSSSDEELDEDGISRRRDLMRQRARTKALLGQAATEEILAREDECASESDENIETSEEEDSSDSEIEEGARLKPIFIRKRDRVTIQERERLEAQERNAEQEAEVRAEQRRRQTIRLVEELVRKDVADEKINNKDPVGLLSVNTDDENEEIEYESWKLRELKRIKREKDEVDTTQRERRELERIRNLTEEQRISEQRMNPRIITNKAAKGKYKFMQKYYHRGSFFLETENNLLRRDYSGATLEDKFDKTVLPKVMQVKNFGRSGRTKYTHLVDQDTTEFEAPWVQETASNLKFQLTHAGGMKQTFEKPSSKKKL